MRERIIPKKFYILVPVKFMEKRMERSHIKKMNMVLLIYLIQEIHIRWEKGQQKHCVLLILTNMGLRLLLPAQVISMGQRLLHRAYAVARGENIIMKSDGSQLRSYCYCLDCASAILKVLIKGKNADAYNISNPDSILSIRQMAEILTASANVNLEMELPTQEEKKRFNPMSNSSLDSTKLIELGWKGLFNAERGFSHTVKILKEMID